MPPRRMGFIGSILRSTLWAMSAQVGAQTVAVENAISNNELQGVNITASESNIRDANMGAEATARTKDQILVTVQSQLLKTVNLNAQDVLKLFGGGR